VTNEERQMRELRFEVVLMTDDKATEAEVAEYIREAVENWGDDNRALGNSLFASPARRMDVRVKASK
jgi:hypothetical protein